MDITYLKEFMVLAKTGQYSEAANRLFIAQSTLSKHIKHMESELGAQLFTRTTRKIELTEQGKILLPYAEQIVELQDAYTEALHIGHEDEEKRLSIGAIPALAQYRITDAMVRFKQQHPEYTLSVTQDGTDGLKYLLRSGACELAFIREMEQRRDDLERIPYAVDELVAVLPSGHACADEQIIPLRCLAGEEFVLLEKGTMLYDLSIKACRDADFTPRVAFTDHKIENILDLVAKGMGVALLMRDLAEHVQNDTLAVVAISPQIPTQINLCYRKHIPLSTAAKLFIDCLKS